VSVPNQPGTRINWLDNKNYGRCIMVKKTNKVVEFIEGLHDHIAGIPQLRKNTSEKSEAQIKAEIGPLIIQYLQRHFKEAGYKDDIEKAQKSFYWEGQAGKYGKERKSTFGARNCPDFVITAPYLVAIEYNQGPDLSTVKQGIGRSLMHTMTEDFHYVYFLFRDESKEKDIKFSISHDKGKQFLGELWSEFNVFAKLV
jgi:hypothetical protein